MTRTREDWQQELWRDLAKDAYGTRSMAPSTEWLSTASLEEIEALWNSMCDMIDLAIVEEREEKARATAEWAADLAKIMADNDVDMKTALRWDMEAYDAYNGDELDIGYYCFLRGIGYEQELPIREQFWGRAA